jgi:hypothetical protein
MILYLSQTNKQTNKPVPEPCGLPVFPVKLALLSLAEDVGDGIELLHAGAWIRQVNVSRTVLEVERE